MHPHIGAAGHSPLDLIASLQALASPLNAFGSAGSLGGAGNGAPALNFSIDPSADASPFGPAAGPAPGAFGMTPDTMNALFAAQSQPAAPSGASGLISQLYSLIDTDGDGSVSKSEFDTTFGQNGKTTSADSLFAKLDANSDGAISPDELTNALQGQDGRKVGHGHAHHGGDVSSLGGAPSAGGASADNLLGSTKGQTVNNSDGSTTTTLSYPDGSQVKMTTAAAGSTGTGNAANNFLERMIQHQAQMLSSWTAGQSLAMSV